MHRPFLLMAAAVIVAGCAGAASRSVIPGKATVLAPGESVELPDAARLRYVRVVQDSRCPPKVQCIRAGDADVAFEFTPAGGIATQMSVNIPESPTASMGTGQLQLLALEFGDAAHATVQVAAARP